MTLVHMGQHLAPGAHEQQTPGGRGRLAPAAQDRGVAWPRAVTPERWAGPLRREVRLGSLGGHVRDMTPDAQVEVTM